jgi:hypothetical protein
MDFSNRGPQLNMSGQGNSQDQDEVNQSRPASHLNQTKNRKQGDWSRNKLSRIVQAVLSLCIVVVIVGLLVFLAISNNTNNSESSYVQSNRLQAVFLSTGQVYFGTIKSLNNNFLVLTNIFYLQTNGGSSTSTTTSSNTKVTLVKLGCEIHAPLDQMVINRSSVTFWENLSPSGQVAQAVNTWEKQNPNGQKCSDQSTAGTAGQTTPQNTTK